MRQLLLLATERVMDKFRFNILPIPEKNISQEYLNLLF